MAKVEIDLYEVLKDLGVSSEQARAAAAPYTENSNVRRDVGILMAITAILLTTAGGTVWQLVTINRELGTMSANLGHISEQLKGQGEQLKTLTEAINTLAGKIP